MLRFLGCVKAILILHSTGKNAILGKLKLTVTYLTGFRRSRKKMELKQLEYFTIVCEKGSFSQAAECLYTSTRKRIIFWTFTVETGMKNWPRWYSFPVEPGKKWSRRPAGRHRLFRFSCGSVQRPEMDCTAGQHKKGSLLCCWSGVEMAAGLSKR